MKRSHLLAILLIVLASCSRKPMETYVPTSIDFDVDPAAMEWTKFGVEQQIGDYSVKVTKASKRTVKWENGQESDRMLVIELAITNKSPTKRLSYQSWQCDDIESMMKTNRLQLIDNHQNQYHHGVVETPLIAFATGGLHCEEVVGIETINPGQSISDIVEGVTIAGRRDQQAGV